MRRFVRRSSGARKARRSTEWLGIRTLAFPEIVAADTSEVTFISSADLATLGLDPPFTVTRTIVNQYVESSSADYGSLSFGILVTDDVAGTNLAVPLPSSNLGFDGWLAHNTEFVVGAGGGTFGAFSRAKWESHAMRIVQGAYGLALVVENFGDANINYGFSIRMLLKLH